MNIEKSLQRIEWRFSQGKEFKPNGNDIEAYNELAEYFNQKEKQQLIDNQLFGKMYIYLFGEFVNYYNCTVMDNIPQKELHKLLDKDLRLIVEDVTDRLNNAEISACMERKGHLDGYAPMKYEEVAENLKIMVNAAINTYSPKHLARV